ncbi:MAG: tetratricopeptide repeat protein [Planctomycetes bacterium]|nr:tetratricopeptide repeat protein [Planctomycetota bacterium]
MLRLHRAKSQLALTLAIVVPIFFSNAFGPEPEGEAGLAARSRRIDLGSIRRAADPTPAALPSMAWDDPGAHNPFRLTTAREPLPPVELDYPPLPSLSQLRLPVLPLPEASALSAALAAPVKDPGPDPGPGTENGTEDGDDDLPAPNEPSLAGRVLAYDRVYTNEKDYQEGKILDETPEYVALRVKGGASRVDIPKRAVVRIERARTLRDVYLAEAQSLTKAGDREGFIEIAGECVRFPRLQTTAVEILREYLSAWDARDVEAHRLLARANRELRDLDGALDAVNAALVREGLADPVLTRMRAELYLELGPSFLDRALADARAAFAGDPGPESKILLARVLEARGDASAAQSAYSDVSSGGSGPPEAALGLGRTLLALGRFDEVGPALFKYSKKTPDSLALAGAALYFSGDLAGAEARFREALAENPDHPEANFGLAVATLESGDADTAALLLGQVEEFFLADPSWPLVAQAVAAERAGDLAEASALYTLAREANPTNWYVDYAEGAGAFERGDAFTAEPLLEAALAARFDFADCLDRLGVIALVSGRNEEARRYFEEAASREPTTARALYLAGAHARLGELDLARNAYLIALDLSGEGGCLPAELGLGWVANWKGQALEAVEIFEERGEGHPYASSAALAIQTNLDRWQWVDRFARANDRILHRKWRETEGHGIEIGIDRVDPLAGDPAPEPRPVAVFEGSQTGDWSPTLLAQVVERDKLHLFEATLRTEFAAEAFVGVGLFPPDDAGGTGLFVFGTTWKGELAYGVVEGEGRPRLTVLGAGPAPGRHVFAIRMAQGARSCDLLLDGEVAQAGAKIDVPFRGQSVRAGVVGLAREGATWKLVLEEARYVFQEGRKR